MAFSVDQITLVSEADTLLQMAQRDKRNIEYRKEGIVLRSVNSVETAAAHTADLANAQQELELTNTQLATLPPGEYRDNQEIKKMIPVREDNKPLIEGLKVLLVEDNLGCNSPLQTSQLLKQ